MQFLVLKYTDLYTRSTYSQVYAH